MKNEYKYIPALGFRVMLRYYSRDDLYPVFDFVDEDGMSHRIKMPKHMAEQVYQYYLSNDTAVDIITEPEKRDVVCDEPKKEKARVEIEADSVNNEGIILNNAKQRKLKIAMTKGKWRGKSTTAFTKRNASIKLNLHW